MKKAWFAFFYSSPKRTWLFLLYFVLLALVHSWIGEDFLITVRSILNFIHGLGPVYNIGERVQAYTHPLWFFLMSGVIALTKEIFYSTVLVSVLFSFLAVLLMSKAHEFEKKPFYFIIFILFITFSSAFMDYTSSGLENPLGYLLFSGLIWCFYKNHYFYLPLLAALLFLTRYDYLFIFVPFLIFYLIQPKQWKGKIVSFSISGFIVLSWLVFSLYYYGSLFPSTYYAKTVNIYETIYTFRNAINYYKATMIRDFLTFLPFIFCFIFIRSRFLDKKDKLVVFSVLPYLLYILWIGGDFMQGRFFAIPFFLTAPIFIKCVFRSYKTFFVKPFRLIICVLLMKMSYSLLFYRSFPIVEFFIGARNYWPANELGILTVNERAVFFEKPFNYFNEVRIQINESYERWEKPQQGFKSNFFCGYLGIAGLIMGKGSHVVDYCGLSDFFLATLKPSYTPVPGHHKRQLPLGYMSTILSKGKVNYICDKNMREHWETVKEKTRAPPKISNLWRNLKDSFEIKQKAHAIPDFRQTLADNKDCIQNLKNLFIQEMDKKAFLKQYPNVFGNIIKYALVLKKEKHRIQKGFGQIRKYVSDHRIFDFSAQVAFGPAKTKCFKVILDSFSDFTVSFIKDGKPFEKVYLTPKKRDSYIKVLKAAYDNSSWIWSVYKVCLKERLETDDLVIRLSCDPTIKRFCYIHSISEIK